jgi:hypothetical protein
MNFNVVPKYQSTPFIVFVVNKPFLLANLHTHSTCSNALPESGLVTTTLPLPSALLLNANGKI